MSAVGSDDCVEASPNPLCCGHYVDDRDFAAVPHNTSLELGNTAVRMFVDLLFKCATQKIIQKSQFWAAVGRNVSLHEAEDLLGQEGLYGFGCVARDRVLN